MQALMSNYSVNIPKASTGTTESIRGYNALPLDDQNESVTLTVQENALLNYRIFRLLKEYETLQDNWDEDGAISPSAYALSQSYYLSRLLDKSGQKVFHVAPGPAGEVMLDLRNEETNRSVEIIFYSSRAAYVTFSENAPPKQGSFEFHLLPDLLEWLNHNTSE